MRLAELDTGPLACLQSEDFLVALQPFSPMAQQNVHVLPKRRHPVLKLWDKSSTAFAQSFRSPEAGATQALRVERSLENLLYQFSADGSSKPKARKFANRVLQELLGPRCHEFHGALKVLTLRGVYCEGHGKPKVVSMDAMLKKLNKTTLEGTVEVSLTGVPLSSLTPEEKAHWEQPEKKVMWDKLTSAGMSQSAAVHTLGYFIQMLFALTCTVNPMESSDPAGNQSTLVLVFDSRLLNMLPDNIQEYGTVLTADTTEEQTAMLTLEAALRSANCGLPYDSGHWEGFLQEQKLPELKARSKINRTEHGLWGYRVKQEQGALEPAPPLLAKAERRTGSVSLPVHTQRRDLRYEQLANQVQRQRERLDELEATVRSLVVHLSTETEEEREREREREDRAAVQAPPTPPRAKNTGPQVATFTHFNGKAEQVHDRFVFTDSEVRQLVTSEEPVRGQHGDVFKLDM